MNVVILAGHPFFKFAKPEIYQQSWDRRWTVRWRDFYSMKQDIEFDTKEEAEAFAAKVNQPPLTVDDEACNLAESDAFWRSL